MLRCVVTKSSCPPFARLHLASTALLAALLLLLASLVWLNSAAARDTTDPVHIAVITSSDANRCFAPGVSTAIRHFTKQKADELNLRGGLAGRQIIPKYYDHFRDPKLLQEQIDKILKAPNLAAIIGISSSARGATVIKKIGESGVPAWGMRRLPGGR